MGRIHLFEFEDQEWMPSFLRNYITDFLSHLSNQLDIFKPIVPIIGKALESSAENSIVDLGSGAGGGWIKLSTHLQKDYPDTKIFLSDYFPNLASMSHIAQRTSNIKIIEESIDARKVPKAIKGLRTLFLVFHHFKPKDAALILQNAVDDNQPICVFEGQERSFLSILGMVFSPITLLVTTPFIRPFKFGSLVFTYLIPILPVLVLWDGVVSCLRTYSIRELKGLVQSVEGNERFNWEVNTVKSGPGKILYLVGIPKIKNRYAITAQLSD
jgi:hypothetical protein